MNSAVRRTGTYFHWLASASAPTSVRAPHSTEPYTGNVLKQFSPSGFRTPFSASVILYTRLWTPDSVASVPAGAFHTPRVPSILAYSPATTPHGAKVRSWKLFRGSGRRSRGKNAAPFGSWTASVLVFQSTAAEMVLTFGGASSRRNARRLSHRVIAAP